MRGEKGPIKSINESHPNIIKVVAISSLHNYRCHRWNLGAGERRAVSAWLATLSRNCAMRGGTVMPP
jgi:hypothetical protein